MKTSNKLENLKVEAKLKKSFGRILRDLIIVLLVGVLGMAYTNLQLRQFYTQSYRNMTMQLEVRQNIQKLDKSVLAVAVQDGRNLQKKVMEVKSNIGSIESDIAVLADNLNDSEKTAALQTSYAELNAELGRIMQCIDANEDKQALEIYNSTYNDAATKMQGVLEEIGTYAETEANSAYTLSRSMGFVLTGIMIAVGVLSIFIGIRMAKSITKAMVAPIYELQAATARLDEGQLDIEITYVGQDELGELADNFRDTCKRIREVISECGNYLAEMAEGRFNLEETSTDSFRGEFTNLMTSMRDVNLQLDNTLKKIKNTSKNVLTDAELLAQNAAALADGASEQAGAVEELLATIENVANIAEESAQNAVNAAKEAKTSVEEANSSREEMNELVKAMERITETSRQIEDIIAAIEEIAEQTNLLSLNASIEAARAGEAGRGFAVVADQIGKLATDSAGSAIATKELIGKAITEIQRGNEIVDNTGKAFQNVLKNMEEFAQIADGAAKASLTQSDMLKQVEQGIEQISSVIQNNTAAAQETSAIGNELSTEAMSLEEMLSRFELREEI